jgi:hypothetical protein
MTNLCIVINHFPHIMVVRGWQIHLTALSRRQRRLCLNLRNLRQCPAGGFSILAFDSPEGCFDRGDGFDCSDGLELRDRGHERVSPRRQLADTPAKQPTTARSGRPSSLTAIGSPIARTRHEAQCSQRCPSRNATSAAGRAGPARTRPENLNVVGKRAKSSLNSWSEWQDLNLRPLRPERSALPG